MAYPYNFWVIHFFQFENTVEPQYSAPDLEMSKSMLYQSVHYIEVEYITSLLLYKYKNVCVCVFVRLFLGHLETE